MKKLILILLLFSNLAFSQYYIPNGINWGSIRGGFVLPTAYIYDATTTQYFAKLSGYYPANIKQSLDTLIRGLKSFYAHNPSDTASASDTTLFNGLDFLWTGFTSNATDGLIPIIGENMSNVDATFISWLGWQCTGTGNKYVNTNFNPSTNGVNYQRNYGTIGVWSETNNAANLIDFGASNGSTGSSCLYAKYSDNKVYYYQNTAPAFTAVAVDNSLGLYNLTRCLSIESYCYKNGLYVGKHTSNSSALVNLPFFLGSLNVNSTPTATTNRAYSSVYIGRFFSQRDLIIIYNLLSNFRNYVISQTTQIVCDGNSITLGYGTTLPYPLQLQDSLNKRGVYRVYNLGVNGQSISAMLPRYFTTIAPYYNASFKRNILIFWEGTNEMKTYTADTVYAHLSLYGEYAQATGWDNYILTICPYLSDSNYVPYIKPINDLILANYTAFGNCIDIGNINSLIYLNRFDGGTWQAEDRVHWTNLSNGWLADTINTVLNGQSK